MARYSKPLSLVDEVRELRSRVKALETNNRNASSSIQPGGSLTVEGDEGQQISLSTDGLARIDFNAGDADSGVHTTAAAFDDSFILKREFDDTRASTGGFIVFTNDGFFGSRDASGDGAWFAASPGDGSVAVVGRWAADFASSGRGALFCGSFATVGAQIGVIIDFGSTMASEMAILVQPIHTASLAWFIDPAEVMDTQFTIRWPLASDVAGYYWCFRITG